MIEDTNITIDEPNRWRLETPGNRGWNRTARPDDPNRYLMISADCHCNEPAGLWHKRLDQKYQDRLPRIEVDANGVKWLISEGTQRSRLLDSHLEGEDNVRNKAGYDPVERLKDHQRDGVDAEIIFPNRASRCGRRRTPSSERRNAAYGTTGRGRPSATTTMSCRRWRRS